jgi:uncharacterized membrane protein YidH (DUF202 family)
MKIRIIGIILIILGIIMLLYNTFNYVTNEKVVDIGPIQINKEVNHPLTWSPVIGLVIAAGGVALLVMSSRKNV